MCFMLVRTSFQRGILVDMWALYTNILSPHTAPLANALHEQIGECVYIYQKHGGEPCRTNSVLERFGAIAICEEDCPQKARDLLLECDFLLTGVRDFDLMENRIRRGKFTAYQSERWFKPESLLTLGRSEFKGRHLWVDGFWKMLLPFAIHRAQRMLRLFKSDKFLYLPIGVHAARDMARLCGLMNGDMRCMFMAPSLKSENYPLGSIGLSNGENEARYCLAKMRMWGYFVESGHNRNNGTRRIDCDVTKVLWVGRMLGWKQVGTIIKSVGGIKGLSLDIFGGGPEEEELHRLSREYANVNFGGMVPITEVRSIMQHHDVYVLSSNEFEGWGAVVNEALEEGMCVLGTYEAGASVTILPETNLYHSGDWKTLRQKLINPIPDVGIGTWTAKYAAEKVVQMAEEMKYVK